MSRIHKYTVQVADAFGLWSPHRQRSSYDLAIQAMVELMQEMAVRKTVMKLRLVDQDGLEIITPLQAASIYSQHFQRKPTIDTSFTKLIIRK